MQRILPAFLGILLAFGAAFGQQTPAGAFPLLYSSAPRMLGRQHSRLIAQLSRRTGILVQAAGSPLAAPDPGTASAILSQSITAALGSATSGPVQDFTATGAITDFSAGQQTQGTATIRGRSPDQFRLDVSLPTRSFSYVLDHGEGFLKDSDGKVTKLPPENTINRAIPFFPYLELQVQISDPQIAIRYVGKAKTVDGAAAYSVQVEQQFGKDFDPDGSLSKATSTQYLVDPATYLIIGVVDTVRSFKRPGTGASRETDLGQYRSIDGIQFPNLIREFLGGQKLWELAISNVSLNTGLTDATFKLQ